MAAGIYLLQITPKVSKIGRSGQLDTRLAYWRSHSIPIGLSLETTDAQSHVLEYALLRANRRCSDAQVTSIMRRYPMMPLNGFSLPQGSSEWVCSDMYRLRQHVDMLWPIVQGITEELADDDKRGIWEAKKYMRDILPRTDGGVD